jgi:TonB family protein
VGTGGGAKGEGGAGGAALSSRGPGERNGAEYGAYLRLWRTRIHEGLSYPLAARRRNLTGTVHIEIAIEANGALSEVRVIESSSHPLLDDAAVESVRNLAPIPFPPELTPRPLRARLPVVFDLR